MSVNFFFIDLHRLGQRLNIAYERTPDTILLEAIEKVKQYMPADPKFVSYTTTESTVLEKITG